MSLHLSHCRETRPSFESGHLGVHSTRGSVTKVLLFYVWSFSLKAYGSLPLGAGTESTHSALEGKVLATELPGKSLNLKALSDTWI